MKCIAPQELETTIIEAVPIIHRYLRRIGSYPYQNDPEDFLTVRVLEVGIFRSFWYKSNDYNDRTYNSKERIQFQSMASLPPNPPEQGSCLRDEADDRDLIDALNATRGRRRFSDEMKIIYRGPKPPPPSHFRPCWSQNMDQVIPTHQFRALLRVMVVLGLCDTGIGAHEFIAYGAQTESVTDCLLASFHPGPDCISWPGFGQAYSQISYSLQNAFHRIFDPSMDTSLSESEAQPEKTRTRSIEEIQTILKKANVASSRQAPTPSKIYNLPILSQLETILSDEISLSGLYLEQSIRHDQINAEELKTRMEKTQTQLFTILLVQGSSTSTSATATATATAPRSVKFGFFYPNPEECIDRNYDNFVNPHFFQLQPIHRVFEPPHTETWDISIEAKAMAHAQTQARPDSKKPTFSASVSWKHFDDPRSRTAMVDWLAQECELMGLEVGEDGSGSFTVQTEEYRVEERFTIDAVEVLGCEVPNLAMYEVPSEEA